MADETVSPLELFLSECPAALLVALGEAWRNTHGPLEGHSCPRAGQTANPSDLPYDALWLRLTASVDAVAAAERKTLTETCVRALFRRFRSPEISDLRGQHKRAIVAAVATWAALLVAQDDGDNEGPYRALREPVLTVFGQMVPQVPGR